MGMFTTIIHPNDGRDLQIKTGWDSCDTYSVGDPVQCFLHREDPGRGTLQDGAYESFGADDWDDWVIIKDHKIHAIVPRGEDVHEGTLWKQFELQAPDRSNWTEEAWEEQRVRREEAEAEAAEFAARIAHLLPAERMGAHLAKKLANKIVTVKPLPDYYVGPKKK